MKRLGYFFCIPDIDIKVIFQGMLQSNKGLCRISVGSWDVHVGLDGFDQVINRFFSDFLKLFFIINMLKNDYKFMGVDSFHIFRVQFMFLCIV